MFVLFDFCRPTPTPCAGKIALNFEGKVLENTIQSMKITWDILEICEYSLKSSPHNVILPCKAIFRNKSLAKNL